MSIVTGLLEPSGGHVLFGGQDIRNGLLEYKARIGYVPEEAHLYTYLTGPHTSRSSASCGAFPRRALAEKIDSLLEIFGLQDDRYAQLAAFSKGMRQKILISAALLHDPDLIVLDEPCSGLDVTSTLILKSLVRTLSAAGKMMVYSSHVLEVVEQVATDVLILHDSRVVAHDWSRGCASCWSCRRSKRCSARSGSRPTWTRSHAAS